MQGETGCKRRLLLSHKSVCLGKAGRLLVIHGHRLQFTIFPRCHGGAVGRGSLITRSTVLLLEERKDVREASGLAISTPLLVIKGTNYCKVLVRNCLRSRRASSTSF